MKPRNMNKKGMWGELVHLKVSKCKANSINHILKTPDRKWTGGDELIK